MSANGVWGGTAARRMARGRASKQGIQAGRRLIMGDKNGEGGEVTISLVGLDNLGVGVGVGGAGLVDGGTGAACGRGKPVSQHDGRADEACEASDR